MYKHYAGTRMEVWIKIHTDPHESFRGFSIKDRELRAIGYESVLDTMQDLRGKTMQGRFWPVDAAEVYRVIPEMKRFPIQEKPWFFPFEFCEAFVRPKDYLNYPVKETVLHWDDEKGKK